MEKGIEERERKKKRDRKGKYIKPCSLSKSAVSD